MTSESELSEREILERMRKRVSELKADSGTALPPPASLSRQYAFVADKGVPGYHLGRLRQHVEMVYQLQSAVGTLNPRPPGLVNTAIQATKKFMSRALSWYTRPLHQFQGAVAQAFEEDLHALESLQNQVTTTITMHQQAIEAVRKDLQRVAESQHEHIATLNDQVDELRRLRIEERLRAQELKLRRLESSGPATAQTVPQPAAIANPQPRELDFNYFLFQEYHRGKESDIRQRQLEYLKHFRGREPVWDLGCGRGEFLELLQEHKIAATGVETDADAIQLCRDKGLNIVGRDLFHFLQEAEDESAGGIFAAQVIEHMPVDMQLRLVDLCFRKLKPGAPLILETINPECLFALARNFYLDPTHIRPVHPEMLRFAMQNVGFADVQVQYSGPVQGKYIEKANWPQNSGQEEAVTDALLALNHFAFGCQDYAAIGWRN